METYAQTIQGALNGLGHKSVTGVRQGKFFEIEMAADGQAAAAREVEQIAREVLTNPVIEDYRVEFLD